MRTFEDLVKNLLELRSEGWTYEQIGDLFGVNKATIWKILNRRKEPISTELRSKLDLQILGSIQFIIPAVNEVVFQAHRALICDCGRAFVPNHPLRTHCFTCSPYRGQK